MELSHILLLGASFLAFGPSSDAQGVPKPEKANAAAIPRANRTLKTTNSHNHSSTSSTTEPPAGVHRYLDNAFVSTHRQVHVPTFPVRMNARRWLLPPT
jgi:hypothetical protein